MQERTLIRPALERLRDLAAIGAIDRLYVHSPDRLARKYAYQVLLLDEFQRCGVEVVFLNHPLGKTPGEDLLLQVQGMVAEFERAKILERSRRGKLHAARQGSVNVLSGAPYGSRDSDLGSRNRQRRALCCRCRTPGRKSEAQSANTAWCELPAPGSDRLCPLQLCVLRKTREPQSGKGETTRVCAPQRLGRSLGAAA